MYIPAYNKNEDIPSIIQFIKDHPFAILISENGAVPYATHIPLEVIENPAGFFLQGHVSKANDHWKIFESNTNVLVIFNGPHAYVSSGWYNHQNVPTWNYIAVHVSGRVEIISEEELYKSLQKLMQHYESGRANPVVLEEMPEVVNKNLKGIVGFNIHVDKIEGKWKLSQNRSEEDFENIIRELEKLNDINSKLVAEEMRKNRLKA